MTFKDETKMSRWLCLIGCFGTLFYAWLGGFEGFALMMALSSLVFFSTWAGLWIIGIWEGYR